MLETMFKAQSMLQTKCQFTDTYTFVPDASFKVNEDSKSESQILLKRNSTQTFPSRVNLKPLIKVSPEELAKQLTLIDWSIFSRITCNELKPGQWTGSMKHILSPNVVDFTHRFNIVSSQIFYLLFISL